MRRERRAVSRAWAVVSEVVVVVVVVVVEGRRWRSLDGASGW
jgi:hypothetical protein